MSTFSGIGTALSSLIAQRAALDVAGQNVANANTVGYTRQRATITSVGGQVTPAMFATSNGIGQGVQVTGIARLGDMFLDARVRSESAGSAYLPARSDALTQLEQNVGEPSKTGLSSQLSALWSAFSDVAVTPGSSSARSVLLDNANAVVSRIATLYKGADTQWTQARSTTAALVDQVNTTAANIADLNGRILAITNAGSSANELSDQRDQLITSLSGLVGATTQVRGDGVIDVYVAGNTLVNGDSARTLALAGPTVFSQAAAGASATLVWADRPTVPVGLTSGRIAGELSVLGPPGTPAGTGGVLTEAAASYNTLATTIATQVNALHTSAVRVDGTAGTAFFALDATKPAALGLSVAITDPAQVAAADPGSVLPGGTLDGSIAAKLAKLGTTSDGPDTLWNATVVGLGVQTASATSRATVAAKSLATASAQQLAQTSVDTDEEAANMLAYQRAYQASSRVLTAIDEMLDTLINRTGTVGR